MKLFTKHFIVQFATQSYWIDTKFFRIEWGKLYNNVFGIYLFLNKHRIEISMPISSCGYCGLVKKKPWLFHGCGVSCPNDLENKIKNVLSFKIEKTDNKPWVWPSEINEPRLYSMI